MRQEKVLIVIYNKRLLPRIRNDYVELTRNLDIPLYLQFSFRRSSQRFYDEIIDSCIA